MMPSPEDFHRDIRAAKRFGLVQGLLLLPSMFSLILAIAFAVGGDWRESATRHENAPSIRQILAVSSQRCVH